MYLIQNNLILVDFAGLFEQGCTTNLKLANPTTDTVLFKIKTTAPKKYCVRPNSGILEPNSKVEIASKFNYITSIILSSSSIGSG